MREDHEDVERTGNPVAGEATDEELRGMEEALGYSFTDRSWLEQALVHRSFSHEARLERNNEPLEFLGDAVLGFLVAEEIVRGHSEMSEGEMTRLRASLVNTRSLAAEARTLGLGRRLRLGRGEERSGGRNKPSLLADGFEALVGAVFLDGGIEPVRALLQRLFGPRIREARPNEHRHVDAKTELQEFLQAQGQPLPEYRVADSDGPDHARRYRIEVWVDGECIGRGSGTAKKRAEQAAAREALAVLKGR
jgi:ribonuclease III